MNKKEGTLKAIDKLIERYELCCSKVGNYERLENRAKVCKSNICELCKLHMQGNCRGCPSANRDGYMGCTGQKTLPNWLGELPENKKIKRFKLRIKFWESARIILETHNPKEFTISGWKYFDDIHALDEKIARKYE